MHSSDFHGANPTTSAFTTTTLALLQAIVFSISKRMYGSGFNALDYLL
jgi:hypothetical protein